jgi:outer membrane receptor protein involved in Fe transport
MCKYVQSDRFGRFLLIYFFDLLFKKLFGNLNLFKMKMNLHITFKKIVFILFWVFAGSQMLMAQTGSVKGTVTDELGEALPGVNIVVEGTSLGASTDDMGVFLLNNIPLGNQNLKVSFIGFEPLTKSVSIIEGKTAEVSFILKEDAFSLQEVKVTASKRIERIQEVPQSISAISGKKLEARGITDATTYIENLPGINVVQFDPTKISITIRGVAPLGGSATTVGYYLGEAPISSWTAPATSSFDVERIEVLRGPQGTLYGEGSMGGTVKIIPNKANLTNYQFKFDPQFSSTRGGFSQQYNAMANIPIIKNKLAFRATGYYQNDDGYFDNLGTNTDKANTFDKYGGRFSLRYLASDKLFFTASAIYNKIETGGLFASNDDYEQNSTIAEPMTDKYSVYSLTANYVFSFANLTVTGTYFNQDWKQYMDLAAMAPVLNGVLEMFGLPARNTLFMDRGAEINSTTAEARLVSSTPGPLKWTVGTFYKKFKSDSYFEAGSDPEVTQEEIDMMTGVILGTPPGTIKGSMYQNSIEEPQQIALFGEVSYDIGSKLNILGGLRVFNETNSFTSISDGLFSVLTTGKMPATLTQESDETVVNPKVTLTYKPTKNILTYANASRGFRRGGLNVDISMYPDVTDPSYKSESFWNYELGLKSGTTDGKLIANAAFYYNVWTDMQVITRNIANMPLTENVGQAHTTGVDLEINWLPLKGLLLTVGGNYTIAETDVDIKIPTFVDPDTGEEHFDTYEKGSSLPGIPKLSFSLAGEYKFSLSENMFLTPRVEYNYTGDKFSAIPDLINGEEIPKNNITNLRLSFDYKRLGAFVYVNNLTDERVKSDFYYNDSEIGKVYWMGRPRTIGIGFRTSF